MKSALKPWRQILGLLILGLLIYLLDLESLLALVANSDWILLGTAALLLFLENVIVALRWKTLLVPLEIEETTGSLLRIYLAGHLLSYFIPTSVVTDVYRAFTFRHRGRAVEVASSLVVERFLGAASVLVAMVMGGFLVAAEAQHLQIARPVGIFTAIFAAGCLVMVLAVGASDTLLRLMPARWPRIASIAERLAEGLRQYATAPRALMVGGGLSLLIQAIRVLTVFTLFRAFGTDVGLGSCLLIVPMAYLTNMVPGIGSRLGTEQGVFVVLFGLLGIAPEPAFAVSIANVGLGALVALPGGLEFLRQRELADD